jgi:hypothetical protein
MHTIDIDCVDLKMEVHVEQIQKTYGGPQATSGVDTNLPLGSRQAPVHCTQSLAFTF